MRMSDLEARIAMEITVTEARELIEGDLEVVETGIPGVLIGFGPREGDKVPAPETHFWVLGEGEEAPPKAHVLTVGDTRIAVQCVCAAGEGEAPEVSTA